MKIETMARKRIVKAITLEKEVGSFEKREKLKGKIVLSSDQYNDLRKKFVEVVCQLNSVANTEGTGRNDLSVDILIAAESVSRRISNSQSSAVRKLADQIKKAFSDIRTLLRKYDENLELVDPQLKNNPELVDVLLQFEKSWGKGKTFFLNPKLCNMLIHFSRLIEGATEKYKIFEDRISAIDTEVFVIIPSLLVLSSLDGDDKGICAAYYPPLNEPGVEQAHYKNTVEKYQTLRMRSKDGYELYNVMEKMILEIEVGARELKMCKCIYEELKLLVNDVKRTAMGLQRHQPAEWNALLAAAMGQM